MVAISYEYPLKMPGSKKLKPASMRKFNSDFPKELSIEKCLTYIQEEVDSMRLEKVKVFTDIEHINSERLFKKLSGDSSVIIEAEYMGSQSVLISDNWSTIEQNLYAAHLTLSNLRKIAKWGVADITQLLSGLTYENYHIGLIADASESWRNALGLGPTATLEDANAIYRMRAKKISSSQNQDEMIQLNLIMDEAKKYLA